ncbi:MAG TPA: DUF4474 domain-containing protein [Mobilitalea sp.]|nr:DUF4474 domain-containing protein [Mobilitalea sp.]
MLFIQAGNLFAMAIASLLALISGNMALFIIGSLLLIFVISIFIWFQKKRKKRKKVTHPVVDIIGNVPERLAELNRDLMPFGFAYEPNKDLFYSLLYPWQRELGYCRLYDEASATLSMIIDCEPIYFKYNGRKWLIEFWKGQYGMTTGGEIGIYYTTGPSLNIPGVFNGTFYYCVRDEDRINMSFVLRKKGEVLFSRNGYHWWLTGFKLGEFTKPKHLSMDIVLDLYDRQMAKAFTNALIKSGYKEHEFAVQGRRVYVHFAKPHTKQPATRTWLTDHFILKNDKSYCKAYNYLTEAYTNTLDKIDFIRVESPNMYNQIMHIGKPKAVYDSYKKIREYTNK